MKLYILNTTGSGTDLIQMLKNELKIKGVIGLSNKFSTKEISDYFYQKNFCKTNNINFIEVNSYSLKNKLDMNKINKLNIDILIIAGWQRLIPEWLINHCKICAIGAHGSPIGITKGRGRSPQNWSLILGLNKFYISIFKIDKYIDSGDVIETRSFKISPYDNIKTSYYKTIILVSKMLINCIKNSNFKKIKFLNQDEKNAEYFPRRKPEDGSIDWTRKNDELRNFIRALSHPYPGAFTYLKGVKVKIWNLIPFDIDLKVKLKPGTIYKIFNKNDLLIKTSESFVLVDDFDVEKKYFKLKAGMKFETISFKKQIKEIIKRHEKKYPKLKITRFIRSIT